MAVKYIPFSPNVIHGQAVLDNFVRTQRILRYRGDGEVFTSLQRGMPYYEAEEQETVGNNELGNLLMRGECVSACAYLKEKGVLVDLVYIDPPFASGVDYSKKVYLRRNPKVAEAIIKAEQQLDVEEMKSFEEKMYGDVWKKEDYLNWMYQNLCAIKSIMSDNACIYVHLDYHIGHYVKILLDEIFGEDNFRNEIVWCYYGPGSPGMKNFNKKHDTIFWYSKSENYLFNDQDIRVAHDEKTLDNFKKGLEGSGFISDNYDLDNKGKIPEDWWEMAISGRFPKDGVKRVDYATEKPWALVERIIKTSSDANMLVADFFGGSGVTATVAHKLGRKFVHNDIGINSIQTTRDRLLAAGASFTHLEIKDGVNLFRNPQQTNDKLMELTGVGKAAFASDFWSGSITDSKLGVIPVHLPNFLPGKRPMVDETFLKVLVHEQMASVPDGTKKVIIYYIDSIDKDLRDEYIRQHNIYIQTEIDFQDLKPILDNVVVEDVVNCSLSEFRPEEGVFPVWQVTINSFISDRVLKNIHDENEKRYQQYLKKMEKMDVTEDGQKPKFVKIEVSDEGLECIEWLSLDCQASDKSAPWHSDVEVKIEAAGYVIRNGKKTGQLWDGTISTDDNTNKPLRLKIRNICGDETIVIL